MKTSVLAFACFLLLVIPASGHARDYAELNAMLGEAMGDDARTCEFLETINREIAAHPGDERLLNLRLNAYGSLADPYSAKPDVDALATLHPGSPAMQLQKCLYEEATGAKKNEYQECYLRVAALCEKLGKAAVGSQEYLLALLLAESPEAAEAKQRFLDALSDSPMDQEMKDTISHFSRDMLIRRVDPSEVRRPCAQKR